MGIDDNNLRFCVGDTAIVRGVRECVFGYNDDMEALVGCAVHITEVEIDKVYNAPSYFIAEDNGEWTWDNSCFEYTESIDFEPISEDELKEFILKR